MRSCWAMLLPWLLTAAVLAGPNKLAEPGFEGVGRKGVARGWEAFPIRGSARGEFSLAGRAHGGHQSQQLHLREAMDGWLQASTAVPGGLLAGHDYEARVWLRGDRRLSEAALCVHDNHAWFPHEYAVLNLPVAFDWQELVLRFRAVKTDADARLGIKLAQEGTLWADDAGFVELTAADRPAPVGGNQLRNGSFEAGLAGWVSHWMSARPVESMGAPDGAHVLELPGGAPGRQLQSSAVSLPWGGPVTLTASLRTDRAVTVKLGLSGQTGPLAEQAFQLTPQWQRCTLTTDLPPLPDGLCHATITPGGARVWVDAVQLECGPTATAYAPRAPLEAGLALDHADGVYAPGEPVRGTLSVACAGAARTVAAHVRLYDLWDCVVSTQTLALRLTPGVTTQTVVFTPPPGLTGHFRAEVEPLEAESVFAVLPPVDNAQPLPLGTHLDYAASLLPRRAGAGWTKSWQLPWSAHEPKPGERKWPQESLFQRWQAAGLKAMAVLSEAPAWAQARPEAGATPWGWYRCRDSAAMTGYAQRMVEHYKDRVDTWELQNEPDASLHPAKGSSSEGEYAGDAVALARGVRAADPQARIVLGSITLQHDPELYLAKVFAAQPELRTLVDVVSYHNYSADPEVTQRLAGRLRAKLTELGLRQPIWDTEWSPVGSAAPRHRYLVKHTVKATARHAAAMVVQGFVCRLGEGVANSFLYHAYGPPAIGHSDFDLVYELDGHPSAVPVAQAVLARHLTGATPLGRRDDLPGCWAYAFRRADGGTLLVVWARETQAEPVPLSPTGKWQASDCMGNPLPGPLVVGDEPVYLDS